MCCFRAIRADNGSGKCERVASPFPPRYFSLFRGCDGHGVSRSPTAPPLLPEVQHLVCSQNPSQIPTDSSPPRRLVLLLPSVSSLSGDRDADGGVVCQPRPFFLLQGTGASLIAKSLGASCVIKVATEDLAFLDLCLSVKKSQKDDICIDASESFFWFQELSLSTCQFFTFPLMQMSDLPIDACHLLVLIRLISWRTIHSKQLN